MQAPTTLTSLHMYSVQGADRYGPSSIRARYATGTGAGTGTSTLCLDRKSQKLAGGSRQLRSGTSIIHLLAPILENPVIVSIILFFSASSAAIHCIVCSTSSPSKRYANQSSLQAALSQSAICGAPLLQRPGLGLIFGYSGKIQTPVPSAGHRLTLPYHLLGAQISIHFVSARLLWLEHQLHPLQPLSPNVWVNDIPPSSLPRPDYYWRSCTIAYSSYQTLPSSWHLAPGTRPGRRFERHRRNLHLLTYPHLYSRQHNGMAPHLPSER